MTSDKNHTVGYCVACSVPRNPQELANCPSCGSVDWDPYTVTPTSNAQDVKFDLPPPWDGTKGEWGRVIGVYGEKGIGKSSLVASLCRIAFPHPDHPEWGGGAWWITGEEAGNQIRSRNQRLGLGLITVHHVDPDDPWPGIHEFFRKVRGNPPKVVVLDSASVFPMTDSIKIVDQLKRWAQVNQALVVIIVQVNAKGSAFGLEALPHIVDAWGFIVLGRSNFRTLGLEKNRFGDLFNKHWRFGPGGQIEIPPFEGRILTVIGSPGSYELLPYPFKDSSRLSEVWQYLQQLNMPKEIWSDVGVLPDYLGYATAGTYAPFLETRFEVPDDWPDRKRYAELHGVPWLDPHALPPLSKLKKRAAAIHEERLQKQSEENHDE